MLPNFLIVGAQKCGTTALAYSLRRHPDVFLPKAKEAHYFGAPASATLDSAAYRRFFREWRGQLHVGEATPNYFVSPSAPQHIFELMPDVKIVVSLRSPVDRAYSAYWHALREGAVRGSFEQVLSTHAAASPRRRWSGLVTDGQYHLHLTRYLGRFRPEQIHVLLHEDLLMRPRRTLDALATFLGLGGPPLCIAPLRQNQASRSMLPPFLRSLVARHSPGLHKRTLMAFVPPPMQAETRAALCGFYRSNNDRLGELLGRDLSSWSR